MTHRVFVFVISLKMVDCKIVIVSWISHYHLIQNEYRYLNMSIYSYGKILGTKSISQQRLSPFLNSIPVEVRSNEIRCCDSLC